MARVRVASGSDMVAIATAAGNASPDARRWADGYLTVDGVTQAALDAAVSRLGATAPGKPALLVPPETWKSDVWRRLRPDERELLDTALQQAPVLQRRLWDDSTVLVHASPDFIELRNVMVDAFGAARTDELLAPSM